VLYGRISIVQSLFYGSTSGSKFDAVWNTARPSWKVLNTLPYQLLEKFCSLRPRMLVEARQKIIGICPWIRKQFVDMGRRIHRPYPRPSFFGTGRSTLLTESSGIEKKWTIINKAQAHTKSTCHIPKENHPFALRSVYLPFVRPTHHPAPTCALQSPTILSHHPVGGARVTGLPRFFKNI
jgi:hypothetical protein